MEETSRERKQAPAIQVIREVLAEVAPERELTDWPTHAGQFVVNGVSAPLVRIGNSQILPFFHRLFDVANDRFFDGALPKHRLQWNRRFRNLGGRIHVRQSLIELSSAHFEACGAAAMGLVLIHEQIHGRLYHAGLSFGHTHRFKIISHRLGMPSIYHQLPLPDRLAKPKAMHWYACAGCRREIPSKIRFRSPRACLECCRRFGDGRFDRRFELRYVTTRIEVQTAFDQPAAADDGKSWG